jgi:hypothetical protein
MRWIYRIAALGVLPFGMVSTLEDFPQLWAGGLDEKPSPTDGSSAEDLSEKGDPSGEEA